jgi:hypothetical protein
MSWKRRILEILLAGGALTACGPDIPVNGPMGPVQDMAVCNANPDPCCGHPELQCQTDLGTKD